MPGPQPLSPEHVRLWRDQGFVVVDGLIPSELVQRTGQALEMIYPSTNANSNGDGNQFRGIGSNRAVFPSAQHSALNELALLPRIVHAAAQLLGSSDLRLSQFEGWAKDPVRDTGEGRRNAAYNNSDQRMHMDYPNNYLTHPSPWERPEAVCLLLYFSDSNDCGGMTRVVPREGASDEAYRWPYVEMPGVGPHEWINDRATSEAYFKENHPPIYEFRKKLYERERAVAFRPGTALLYRLDTWHRGAPMRPGTSQTRRVINMMLRRGDAEWITTWNQGVARSVYAGADEIVARATAEQRSLLGFPAPGHPYWTEHTISAARSRYGEAMDMSEYEAGLRGGALRSRPNVKPRAPPRPGPRSGQAVH